MISRRRALGCTLLLALLLSVAPAWALDVPLSIRNDLDVAREGAMMRVGVPFAPGQLGSVDDLGASGPGGAALPFHARALSSWWDGSPRWVLVEFPVDVAAGGTVVYNLSDVGAAAGTSPLAVSDDGTTFTVETGRIRFTVRRDVFRVLETAELDSDGDGSYDLALLQPGASAGLVVEGTDGRRYTAAAAPSSADIESQGPTSITLRFEGTLIEEGGSAEHLRYVTRITAYANRADLKIQQTLHNPHMGELAYGSSGSQSFSDARIELATTLSGALGRVGGQEGQAALSRFLGASDHIYLHQDSSGLDSWNKYAGRKNVSFRGWEARAGVEGSESVLGSGDRAEGWVELVQGDAAVALSIAEFWQNFPNAVDAYADGRIAGRFFSRYQAQDHSLRGGDQKTHVLHLRLANDGGADSSDELRSAGAPLMGLAPPEQYLQSRSFRRTVQASQSPSSDYELIQRSTLYGGEGWRTDHAEASLQGNLDYDDVYGWWDWGDFYADYEHEGDRANQENDMVYAMILQMVRSQNPDWWRFIDPGARHLADLDIYHTQEDMGWRNGGFFTHDRTGSNQHRQQYPTPGHYNGQGMFTYYYLTGDPVVRDAALELAENTWWRVANDGNGGYSQTEDDFEIRCPAWTLNIHTEAWKLTGEQRFLDGALDIITRSHPDRKCWDDGVNQCQEGEFIPSWEEVLKTWQLGMLMCSIGEFLDNRTIQTGAPDAVGVTSLQGFADFLQRECWLPEVGMFAESFNIYSGPGGVGSGSSNFRIVDGLVYAFRHTNDTTHIQHVGEAFATATANPWYDGSGITWSNVKTQALMARNGGAYLELALDGIEPVEDCMRVIGTNPGNGQGWDPSGMLLILFDAEVDPSSLEPRLTVSGSTSGTLTPTVSYYPFTASLAFAETPVDGETLTLELASGVSSTSGRVLDGDNDGVCGGVFSFQVVVGDGGGGDPDTSAPADIDDLEMRFHPDSGLPILSWTAPADEGPTGRPAVYEFRYSTRPMAEPFDWDSAITLEGAPAPEMPGTPQEFYAAPIDAQEGTLRVAMRSMDAAGNFSPVSNTVHDEFGPGVLFADGPSRRVEEGTVGSTMVFVSDWTSGMGRLIEARYRYDDESLLNARPLDLIYVEGSAAAAIAYLELDAQGWFAGELHRVHVEARDDAGNWSPLLAEMILEVVSEDVVTDTCFCLSTTLPADGSTLEALSSLTLVFSRDVDVTSVHAGTLEMTGVLGETLSPELRWLAAPRVLELRLDPPVQAAGDVTLHLDASIRALDGSTFLQGIDCPGGGDELVLHIAPGGETSPFDGTPLGEKDQEHGLIAVESYDLVLTDLVPGDTLSIYNTAGHLLHREAVSGNSWSLDTRRLGDFPAKHVIVVYRGHKQHVMVGRGLSYRSYLE